MKLLVERGLISADSHVVEPADLWLKRLDKRFRDRAPRVYWDSDKGGWYFGGEGILPCLVPGMFAAGKTKGELDEHYKKGYAAAPAGINDPSARLKEMEMDGVVAEVLHTSFGFGLFWLDDAEFQEACFKVYNEWLSEFISYNPSRLIGLGLVSLWDVEHGVRELHRCAKLGLKGAMIWASAPPDKPFNSPDYDIFWQAAQELRMPVDLHILTGRGEESRDFFEQKWDRCLWRVSLSSEAQRSLASIIFSGVLDRFPELQIVYSESDIGWIAHFLYIADEAFKRYSGVGATHLKMRPSEYFQRQVSATFIEDPVGILTIGRLGDERFMWSNDYPHQSSKWPHSIEIVTKELKGISSTSAEKILHYNCSRLYNLSF